MSALGTEQEELQQQRRDHHNQAAEGYQSKKKDKRAAKETWKGKTRTLRESNHVNSRDAAVVRFSTKPSYAEPTS